MIIIYQLAIFILILISELLLNRYAIFITELITGLWTTTHIFYLLLMILQFGTIILETIL